MSESSSQKCLEWLPSNNRYTIVIDTDGEQTQSKLFVKTIFDYKWKK